ncbi:hypothetical protein XU18_4677 [Perkinsela sp. CCAP 1560/4]|nr:hypothetical protein XU18_4677 [Perkinsela sp. CCAP 1560/4]|eukprot:KNH04007.1 hypothetical protein XU18_4677 [Perkinsela sp. CCAP 1560/4]
MYTITGYYDSLARRAADNDRRSTSILLNFARYDERAVRVICHYDLIPKLFIDLEDNTKPEPYKIAVVELLRKVTFYDVEGGDYLLSNFARICSVLSRAQTVGLKVSTAELIANVGRVQPYRSTLFNYSEAFRHLVIERDPFQERAVCACLAYIFCDDYMGDAVSKIQYKTDILNYVNNLFLRTTDFCAWRYSVRCLYLAGGFNEDKADVDRTRDLAVFVNRMLPEFSTYFLTAYIYARRRHTIVGVGADHTPRWVVRRRAGVGALFCALLGVYSGSYHEWRLDKIREKFNDDRNREMRRRKAFRHSKKGYVEQKRFDSVDSITQTLFWKQFRTCVWTGVLLMASQYPFNVWRKPGWAKNITFYFPGLAVFLPIPMGVPAPFRRAIPFIVVPFCGVKLFQCWTLAPASLHDYSVRLRHWRSK